MAARSVHSARPTVSVGTGPEPGRPFGRILGGPLPQFADPLVDAGGHLPHGRQVRAVSRWSEGERQVQAGIGFARRRLGSESMVENGGQVGGIGQGPGGDGGVEGGFGVAAGGFDGVQAGGQGGPRRRGGDSGGEGGVAAVGDSVAPGGGLACSLSRSCQIGNKVRRLLRLLDGQVPGFDRGQRLPRFVPAEHAGQHRHRVVHARLGCPGRPRPRSRRGPGWLPGLGSRPRRRC